MIKHLFAPWLCAAFCLVAVCGSHQSAQAASKNVKLAFVTNNASDFWTIARAGCTQASKDLGNISVEFKIPADGTAATQTGILDDLLSKGIDGIAISPVDPTNEAPKLNEVAK
jgi:ribose transport system substrate-binding protein